MRSRLEAKGISVPSTTDEDLPVYINWGRWIAECPDGCGDAVVASRTAGRLFYACGTPGCLNTTWYKIVYPSRRAAIETELRKRPYHPSGLAVNWNWIPGESLQDVKDENARRGL